MGWGGGGGRYRRMSYRMHTCDGNAPARKPAQPAWLTLRRFDASAAISGSRRRRRPEGAVGEQRTRSWIPAAALAPCTRSAAKASSFEVRPAKNLWDIACKTSLAPPGRQARNTRRATKTRPQWEIMGAWQ